MIAPPKIIDSQFQVLNVLGQGMSGAVFKVSRGQEVWALKLLKSNTTVKNKEDIIDGFKFEFSLLKDIVHPHVVRIGDFGYDRQLDCFYFTQELVNGEPLHQHLKNQPMKIVEEVFVQCLEGLDAIHKAGALHGDIKPANIFAYNKDGKPFVKILDLGVAHPKFRLTAGTPSYFAPERILKDVVDDRADLYSLAVTFYEILTHSQPFRSETLEDTLKAQTSVIPPSAGSLNPAIPPYLNHILDRLLKKNPRDRYRNAREVLTEIDFEHGLTKGREIKAPIISEKWFGREEILEQIRQWAVSKTNPACLIVTGPSGIGKSQLLQEIKYEFELQGHPIRQLKMEEGLAVDQEINLLNLLDCDEANNEAFKKLFHSLKANQSSLLLTSPLDAVMEIKTLASAEGIPTQEIHVTPFTRDDLRQLIVDSTHDQNPPEAFIDKLFEQTKGHPRQTVRLLVALCRDNQLIDDHGVWNLALFREGNPDEYLISESDSVIIDRIEQLGDDNAKIAEVLILQTQEKLRSGHGKECVSLLDRIEHLIKSIPPGQERIRLRARLLEIKGWQKIQEGQLEDAKAFLESSISLIEESGITNKALLLRILNFKAFILNQRGHIDEAITLFEKTHRQWKEELTPEEQKQVTNNDLGIALMNKRAFERAIPIFNEFLKFYEKLSDETYLIRCEYNLGECYYGIANYQQAIDRYANVVEHARRLKNWQLLMRAYNGLGNAYNMLNEERDSLENYQRALDLARYLRDFLSAAAIAQNMGVIEQTIEKTEHSINHLTLSLKMLKQVNQATSYSRQLNARANLELGQIYRRQRSFDQAKDLFLHAKNIVVSDQNLLPFNFWVYKALAELALDSSNEQEFTRIYPDLLHAATTDDQKKLVKQLKQRSSIDPTQPTFQGPFGHELKSRQVDSPASDVSMDIPTVSLDSLEIDDPNDMNPLFAILEINQFLNSERDLETLLRLILKYALNLTKAESGLILLVNDDNELEVKCAQNIDLDEDLSQISQQVANKVLHEGKILRSENATEDAELKEYQSVINLGLKSIYCVPIRSQRKVLGVLYLVHRFQSSLFKAESEQFIQAFADQAGMAIENARMISHIAEQNQALKSRLDEAEDTIENYESLIRERGLDTKYPYTKIITQSHAMEKVFHLLNRVSGTNLSVLVRGESGTGKELIAKAIHENSPRKDKPFMAINCGAMPANLIESELFGYKAGAFTGANRDKKGLFEECRGGTLFLDEIGELEITLQSKLLRALQEREIMRLGDTKPIAIDMRVVAATLRNLQVEMKAKRFREDLFYRIAEVQIELPPLRERREDIPLLVEHFLDAYAKEHGLKKTPKADKRLMHLFANYPWPGNIRELANRVRVAAALSDGKIITAYDLPEADRQIMQAQSDPSLKSMPQISLGVSPQGKKSFFEDMLKANKSWKDIETVIMAKALICYRFNVIEAAEQLGIGQATLYNRLRAEKVKTRRNEFEVLPYDYAPGQKLDEIKKEVFALAHTLADQKLSKAARMLDVSNGMFAKWIKD